VYNEVNHGSEWGGNVDPADYAQELSKTILALKAKSSDFFVLNAPLDLALPTSSTSLDAETFYQTMENSNQGIFSKLDGWASHSYPNPGFVASPTSDGRLGIRGYLWEQNLISAYLRGKTLPVFITETGWKHSNSNSSGLDEDTIASFYQTAFTNIWNDKNIIAVTPFVFDFPDKTLGAFSFKDNADGEKGKFFKYYYVIRDLLKGNGQPRRDNLANNLIFNVPKILIVNLGDNGQVSLKNVGNYVWELGKNTNFKIEAKNAKISNFKFSKKEVLPGEVAEASFRVKGAKTGKAEIKFTAVSNGKPLASKKVSLNSVSLIQKIIEGFNSSRN
jgi:hypothetical protein